MLPTELAAGDAKRRDRDVKTILNGIRRKRGTGSKSEKTGLKSWGLKSRVWKNMIQSLKSQNKFTRNKGSEKFPLLTFKRVAKIARSIAFSVRG